MEESSSIMVLCSWEGRTQVLGASEGKLHPRGLLRYVLCGVLIVSSLSLSFYNLIFLANIWQRNILLVLKTVLTLYSRFLKESSWLPLWARVWEQKPGFLEATLIIEAVSRKNIKRMEIQAAKEWVCCFMHLFGNCHRKLSLGNCLFECPGLNFINDKK